MLKKIACASTLLLAISGPVTAAVTSYDILINGFGWSGGLSIGIPVPIFASISVDDLNSSVTSFELTAGPTNWTQGNFGSAPALSFDSAGNLTGFNLNQSYSGAYTMTLRSINHFELFDGANYVSCTGCVSFTQAVLVPSVPEPDVYAMMLAGMGLICAFAARRRRRKAM